jgi:MraZ protein
LAAVGGDGVAGKSSENGGADGRALFRGVSDLVLDAKGRLAVPARHRDGLVAGSAGRLVLTADHAGCLLIYPLRAWEPIQERLMALPSFDDRMRSIQRLYVGHADDVELDAAGRILIPPALRRYASLDKRVVLVGQGPKLELWDDARWQAQIARTIAFPSGLPSGLEGLSL